MIFGDRNNGNRLNVQGAYAFGNNANYGSGNNMIYGDGNAGNRLNVQGAYSFGSNTNTGNGNSMIYGDGNAGNRLNVQGAYSFGTNANYGSGNKMIYGDGNAGNVQQAMRQIILNRPVYNPPVETMTQYVVAPDVIRSTRRGDAVYVIQN
jgi:hypothetical protein